jgi:hypothetical protein
MIGNGANIFFWSDRWLNGKMIQDLAPKVVRMVSSRSFTSRTVAQALHNWQWVRDIVKPLFLIGLQQYLQLWDALSGVVLVGGLRLTKVLKKQNLTVFLEYNV